MGLFCIICGANENEVKKLHCFPKGKEKAEQWQEALHMQNCCTKQKWRICDRHFSPSSYVNEIEMKLNRNAVPSVISTRSIVLPSTSNAYPSRMQVGVGAQLEEMASNSTPLVNYKEATTSHLHTVIIDKSDPLGKISPERAVLVKRAMTEELDKLILSPLPNTEVPKFLSWTYSDETVRVVCVDDRAVQWLSATTTTIKPWKDAELAIISSHELPRLTKVSLWISEEEDTALAGKELIIRRLAIQNEKVTVAKWTVYHYEANPRGHLLMFGIGDEDMKTLTEDNMTMSYLFCRLILVVVKEDPEKEAMATQEEFVAVDDPLQIKIEPNTLW